MVNANVKRLLVSLAAVVALGGVYLVEDHLLDQDRHRQLQEAAAAKEAAVVLAIPEEEIRQLTFTDTREGDPIRLSRDAEGTWHCPDDEALVVRKEAVARLTGDLAELSATRAIGAQKELENYGLAQPRGIITVEKTDGTSAELLLGDRNDSSRALYFALGEAPETVYLTKTALDEHFSGTLGDFADYESFPALTASQIRQIRVEKESGSYVLTTPGDDKCTVAGEKTEAQPADLSLVGQILDELSRIIWLKNLEYNCEDFAQYGLDAPRVVLTIESEPNIDNAGDDAAGGDAGDDEAGSDAARVQLAIGAADENGNYYVRLADSPQVHSIRREYLEKLAEASADDFLSLAFSFVSIGDVDYLEATWEGQPHRLERIARDGLQDDAHLTWLVDGQAVSKEVFTAFYYACVSVTAQERILPVPDLKGKACTLRLTYHLTDGTQKEMAYYEADQNFYTVLYEEGTKAASVNKLYVKQMLDALEELIEA